jgi:hypothetical protein
MPSVEFLLELIIHVLIISFLLVLFLEYIHHLTMQFLFHSYLLDLQRLDVVDFIQKEVSAFLGFDLVLHIVVT